MTKILAHYLLSISSLFLVGLFYTEEILLFLLLGVLATNILLLYFSKKEVVLFVLVGIAGTLAEVIAIAFGAWTYADKSLYTVPFWLPVLWGIAGIFIKRLYEHVEYLAKKYKK